VGEQISELTASIGKLAARADAGRGASGRRDGVGPMERRDVRKSAGTVILAAGGIVRIKNFVMTTRARQQRDESSRAGSDWRFELI